MSALPPHPAAERRFGTRGMPRAERERLILERAGGVFARRGYAAASMDEMAELAGVSKPMLYSYFGSKEGLYASYIVRMGTQLLERLVSAGSPEDPEAVRVRARLDEFFAFVEENQDGWRVLFREAAGGAVALQVAELRSQIAGGVARLIADGLAIPVSAAVDAVAHAIVGAGESMANWWLAREGVSRAEVAALYAGVVEAAVRSLVRER